MIEDVLQEVEKCDEIIKLEHELHDPWNHDFDELCSVYEAVKYSATACEECRYKKCTRYDEEFPKKLKAIKEAHKILTKFHEREYDVIETADALDKVFRTMLGCTKERLRITDVENIFGINNNGYTPSDDVEEDDLK